MPDLNTGACPSGTTPVYRLFNKRRDANHRYTIDVNVKNAMMSRGYTSEGYGSRRGGVLRSDWPLIYPACDVIHESIRYLDARRRAGDAQRRRDGIIREPAGAHERRRILVQRQLLVPVFPSSDVFGTGFGPLSFSGDPANIIRAPDLPYVGPTNTPDNWTLELTSQAAIEARLGARDNSRRSIRTTPSLRPTARHQLPALHERPALLQHEGRRHGAAGMVPAANAANKIDYSNTGSAGKRANMR